MQKLINKHGNKINFLALVALVIALYCIMYLSLIIWQNSPLICATVKDWAMVLGGVMQGYQQTLKN